MKFPHGMKYVADYVHEKGLKFGIYSCAGTQACSGGFPGSYEHEFIDAKTFAEWGVDFLKYDYCYHTGVVHGKYRYRRMGLALENCGRDILFSASSWGLDETESWIKTTPASMWRSTGDINDFWETIKHLIRKQLPLFPYNGVGCFNDMDMLVVGIYGKGNVSYLSPAGCTDTQYRTHFSAWAFLGSPLMIGCDVRNMSEETVRILTNTEVIAINQDVACRQPFLVYGPINGPSHDDDLLIFAKHLSNGDLAVGMFNLSEEKTVARFVAEELALPHSTGKTLEMHELWTNQVAYFLNDTFAWELEPCGCAVFRAKVVDL